MQQGRDPRGLTEDIVRHLRDCFLSLMAPELVALPEQKATMVAEQASRLGAARTVRAMERLGEMLVEMRHAPDPRLLLEVALVQLTHEPAANDVHTLIDPSRTARASRRARRLRSRGIDIGTPVDGGARTHVDRRRRERPRCVAARLVDGAGGARRRRTSPGRASATIAGCAVQGSSGCE